MRSWVESANGHPDFPLENLPFGVFRRGGDRHICVAVGDQLLDLFACHEAGLITESACMNATLNELMSRGRGNASRLREHVAGLLGEEAPEREQVARHLVDRADAEMVLPAAIGDY